MPRAPTAPSFGWTHFSWPVTASSATIERFFASTYIVPSTISGLNRYASPDGYVHATVSWPTLVLSICLSDEYCDESTPPPFWSQPSKSNWPGVALATAGGGVGDEQPASTQAAIASGGRARERSNAPRHAAEQMVLIPSMG